MFPIRSSASFDREEGPVSPTLEAASIFRKASKAIRYVLALAHTVISSGTIFGVWRTLITCVPMFIMCGCYIWKRNQINT